MPRRNDIHKILIIGSGPIVIGQACEFDYSGTQACKALREDGYEVVLINSNPATIMTDPETADRTYVEPITWQYVAENHRGRTSRRSVADARRADRAQRGHGSASAAASCSNCGVELIGAKEEVIAKAEEREIVQEGDAEDRPRRSQEPHRATRSTRPATPSARSACR